jgi:hypothetical protein
MPSLEVCEGDSNRRGDTHLPIAPLGLCESKLHFGNGVKITGDEMNRRMFKTIETPTGDGEIRKAGEHFAYVSYSLQVQQEILTVESVGGKKEQVPSGMQDISGEVALIKEEEIMPVLNTMNSNQSLTLHLADGRRLSIVLTMMGDPFYRTYRVSAASSAGLVSG